MMTFSTVRDYTVAALQEAILTEFVFNTLTNRLYTIVNEFNLSGAARREFVTRIVIGT